MIDERYVLNDYFNTFATRRIIVNTVKRTCIPFELHVNTASLSQHG